jgi:hyperosmotically inducible periplasmic protein
MRRIGNRYAQAGIAGLAIFVFMASTAVWGMESSDAWVTTKAKVAILSSVGTTGTSVHVDTVDGLVTLHGTVASTKEKRAAEKATREVEGAKDVRNLLEVVKTEDAKTVAASDDEIASVAKQTLLTDPALKGETGISVNSVHKGTVLLDGKATTLSSHLRAIEDVRAVPGVRRVASAIVSPDSKEIREATLPSAEAAADEKDVHGLTDTAKDLYITSATKVRLLADSKTPGTDIHVDTTDGVVTLFGTVSSETAKAEAAKEAEKVSGVKKVVNDINVSAAK